MQSIGSIDALSAQDEARLEQNAMHRNTLAIYGKNAKICLKILKQKSELKDLLTDEAKVNVIIALKAYLDALNNFHIYRGEKRASEKPAH